MGHNEDDNSIKLTILCWEEEDTNEITRNNIGIGNILPPNTSGGDNLSESEKNQILEELDVKKYNEKKL